MPAEPLRPPARADGNRRRDPLRGWGLLPIGGLLILTILFAGQWLDRPSGMSNPGPEASIVIGEVGGAIFRPTPTPLTTAPSTPPPTAPPTPAPTPAPTRVAVATPASTLLQTPVPPMPLPATPVPATPKPTVAVAAASDPADVVARFYGHTVDEEFDAAYALWSDRMKLTFPREENLDGRFDDTAAITFIQLQTVARDSERALVQANFVERYESGGTREFIGYWEVVLVGRRWLLDQPHY